LEGGLSYKQALLQYNQDDCVALRRVTEFVAAIASTDVAVAPITNAAVVRTSVLSKDKDHRAQFGKPEFALENFAKINECAYFDYQRDRVFARERRSSPQHRRRKNARDLSRNINKVVDLTASHCPKCGARKLIVLKSASRRVVDIKISQSGVKR